ncbi:MAG: LapA family protein [Alphaproteobacteria bacterium]|nr:LapA family protein [Alphaproteobacteria bacterium]
MRRVRAFLIWLLLPPLAVLFIAFAIANRAAVAVSLDPLPFVVQVPLYLLVFVAILLGLVVGGLIGWGKAWRWRRLAAERLHQLDNQRRPAVAATGGLPARVVQG